MIRSTPELVPRPPTRLLSKFERFVFLWAEPLGTIAPGVFGLCYPSLFCRLSFPSATAAALPSSLEYDTPLVHALTRTVSAAYVLIGGFLAYSMRISNPSQKRAVLKAFLAGEALFVPTWLYAVHSLGGLGTAPALVQIVGFAMLAGLRARYLLTS